MPTAYAPTPVPAPHSDGGSFDPTLLPSDSGWLTTADAAQVMGITPRGVRKAAAEGRLRACKPAWLGLWLISAEDVAKAVEAKGVHHD